MFTAKKETRITAKMTKKKVVLTPKMQAAMAKTLGQAELVIH